jgi:hypothetical protein
MQDNRLLEAVANLVLESISVREDAHLYARTLSSEYNAFWELLDESFRSAARRRQQQNMQARLNPFSLGYFQYYEKVLTKEGYHRARGLPWKEQLKIILGDRKFRILLSAVLEELKLSRRRDYARQDTRVAASN